MNNTEKVLTTWYPKDNPKHFEMLHPALALAGETGELLDLLKKHLFKPGVIWDDKLDGELGDWTYYDRIIDYIINNTVLDDVQADDVTRMLVTLNYVVATFTYKLVIKKEYDRNDRAKMQGLFNGILFSLGKDYQEIVDKNYVKLNPADGSKHGWANAE